MQISQSRIAKILAALGLVAALTATAVPAFAADSVVQAVNGGARTATVADLTLSAVNYSHLQQSNTGTMVLAADDSSGTGQGWNVTIQSSAFVYSGANSGTNIPAANFAITTANAPTATSGQTVDATNGPKVPATGATGSLDTAHKVVQANASYGQGSYSENLAVTLTIPAQTRAGTYTGTLTTTIAAAP
jgi:WxL domain surface cell wall-binding